MQRLAAAPLLLDGAMGSMLIARGLPAGRAPECWVMEEPTQIRAIHGEYVEAGSDLILTCTFGANRAKLSSVGLGDRCLEVNTRAVDLAREAAGDRALVGGDLGPTGLLLPPLGRATVEEIADIYRDQAAHLSQAGADVLVLETVFDLREALAAIEACRETGLGVIGFMTFEKRPRGFFTMMGDPLQNSLQAMSRAGADGVGVNCSVPSDTMLEMVRHVASVDGLRVLAQPNAGPPRPGAETAQYDASPDQFARDVVEMLRSGSCGAGGCCGTTPAFIRSLRSALECCTEA